MNSQAIALCFSSNEQLRQVFSDAFEQVGPHDIDKLTERFRQALVQKCTSAAALEFSEVQAFALEPVPEELSPCVRQFLSEHPDWNPQRLIAAALSLFLMQNGTSSRVVNRLYLSTLFGCAA